VKLMLVPAHLRQLLKRTHLVLILESFLFSKSQRISNQLSL